MKKHDSSAGKAEADKDQMDALGLEENEDIEISEDLIDSIAEKLTVDMGARLSGWAGQTRFPDQERNGNGTCPSSEHRH